MTFLETIKEKNQFPIIFIGSGITQRYFKNSPTWEGLLKDIWMELFDEDDFYTKVHELGVEYNNGFDVYLRLADYLEDEINKAFWSKKISLPEMNARINELLKQSIKSDGVINLFSDIKEEFSLFDPKFLQDVANMKEKNLAVELLKKLIAEQVSVYRRTNIVKSEKFSEIMQRSLNAYLNGMLTNEEVIEEMLKLAKQIAAAHQEGDGLGLTADELAFYDALTKPHAIKDFYENEELIAITKELADTLRKNKTIDWQKRESARAKMRMLIKKLLKKHKYPPEGMDDAVQTVMTQCELWTDNYSFEEKTNVYSYNNPKDGTLLLVAEDGEKYN